MTKIIPFPEDPPPGPNNIPQRDIDLLQNLGIHIDHLDDLAAGRPSGAEIIDIKKRNESG